MTALCQPYSIGNANESQPMSIAGNSQDSTGWSRPEQWFTAAFIAYCCLGAHFSMRNAGGVGLDMPANVVTWLFASVFIGAGFWQISTSHTVVYSRFVRLGLLGCLGLLIPWFYPKSLALHYEGPRMLALIMGLMFYVALLQFNFSRQRLMAGLYWLLVCCAIEITLSLTQYFLLTEGNWVGYDSGANRPYGVFQQPNVMASLVATGLALSLYLYSQPDRPAWSGPLHAFVAASGALLIIVLQSRTGQLGAFLALLFLAPYVGQRSRRHLVTWLMTLTLGLGLGFYSQNYSDSVTSVKRDAAIYTQDSLRVQVYATSLDLIAANPLMGVGVGRFEEAWQTGYAQSAERTVETARSMLNLIHPHNEILYWAVEGGLLPVMGLLVMVFSLSQLLRRHPWRTSLAWLGLLVPIVLHTQTEMPFFASSLHWLLLLGLLNFIDASGGQRHELRLPSARLARLCAWLFPLIGVPFMLTGLHTQYLLARFQDAPMENVELLDEIINPIIALDKIQGYRRGLQFVLAISEKDTETLRDYIVWADKAAIAEPRLYLYYNRIIALRQLEQSAAADELLAAARWRFADHPKLTPLLDGSAEASFMLPTTATD
jgi:O-antigen polymerase